MVLPVEPWFAAATDPIVPMDLSNMRENGVRSLSVQCKQCRHHVIINVDHLAGDITVPSLGAADGLLAMQNCRRRRPAELAGAATVDAPDRRRYRPAAGVSREGARASASRLGGTGPELLEASSSMRAG